jgi:pilus assembly protein CpaB
MQRLISVRDALLRHRVVLLVLLAVALGAFSVVGMRNYIGERLAIERELLVPRHQMVEVLVAKRHLERGEPLSADTLAVREIPAEFAPGGALQPSDFDEVSGSRLAVAMRRGEPLLPGMLLDAESNGLSARLKPGSRALTISVDEVNSLSGMLQPGDRIDLMLSLRPSGALPSTEPEVTRTLMQDVLVLATGRQVRPVGETAGRSFTAITVEVDPGQAQKLVVAQRSGRLTAMLRNPDDRLPVAERKLDVNTLLGIPDPPPPPPPPAPPIPRVVAEVIVGGRGALAIAAGTGGPSPQASVAPPPPAVVAPTSAAPTWSSATPAPALPPGIAAPPPSSAIAVTPPAVLMPGAAEAVPVIPPSLIR